MEIIKGMVMPRKHGRFSNYSIADQMEVGDCVKVPTQKEGRAMYHRFRSLGRKCATRKLEDGTIGVWRTE